MGKACADRLGSLLFTASGTRGNKQAIQNSRHKRRSRRQGADTAL